MAKLPPFDQWQRPWAEDEFDEDRAAKRIYDLLSDKEKQKVRLEAVTSERDELHEKFEAATDEITGLKASGASSDEAAAEIRALKSQVRTLEKGKSERRPEDQAYIDRLEIANDFGLTTQDAKRLVGSTRDELEADAQEFAPRIGGSRRESGEGGDDGTGGGEADPIFRQSAPTRQVVVGRESLRTGGDQPRGSVKKAGALLADLPPLD
jgi:hypothetical protein